MRFDKTYFTPSIYLMTIEQKIKETTHPKQERWVSAEGCGAAVSVWVSARGTSARYSSFNPSHYVIPRTLVFSRRFIPLTVSMETSTANAHSVT